MLKSIKAVSNKEKQSNNTSRKLSELDEMMSNLSPSLLEKNTIKKINSCSSSVMFEDKQEIKKTIKILNAVLNNDISSLVSFKIQG